MKNDISYMKEMIYFCNQAKLVMRQAEQYGVNMNDELIIGSLAMQLGHIGEQLDSGKMSKELQKRYSHIDWPNIKGLRIFLFHEYAQRNPKLIYKVYENEIANDKLQKQIEAIIALES